MLQTKKTTQLSLSYIANRSLSNHKSKTDHSHNHKPRWSYYSFFRFASDAQRWQSNYNSFWVWYKFEHEKYLQNAVETYAVLIRITLVEIEENNYLYSLNAQKAVICCSESDGRKYCFVKGHHFTETLMAHSQDFESIIKWRWKSL